MRAGRLWVLCPPCFAALDPAPARTQMVPDYARAGPGCHPGVLGLRSECGETARELRLRRTEVHVSNDPSDKTGETTGSAEGSAGKTLSLFSMALWGSDGPSEDVLGRADWLSSCSEDDGHDDDCWGHVSPIREPVAIPPPNMLISREDMQAIAMGVRAYGHGRQVARVHGGRPLVPASQLDRSRHLRSDVRGQGGGLHGDLGEDREPSRPPEGRLRPGELRPGQGARRVARPDRARVR